jgi:hypothetical protein
MFDDIQKEIEEMTGELDFNSLDSFESPADKRREEWLLSRRGIFTGSESIRLMGYEDKAEFPAGGITYATEKALECITIPEKAEKFSCETMEWGSNTEVEACEQFMLKYNINVVKYGDDQELTKKGEHFGATCDGHILDEQGFLEGTIETKCPNSKTHLDYMRNINLSNFKKELTKYYWQIQTGLYATGGKYCYFISYDPRFLKEENRLFVLKIERNEDDINKFRRRLSQAIKVKQEILDKYI